MTVELFMKLDGIKGESSEKAHKDEIEVLSYSWEESETTRQPHQAAERVAARSSCRI